MSKLSTFYQQSLAIRLLKDIPLKIWQNRHVMLEEEGSELQYADREENIVFHAEITLPLRQAGAAPP